METSINKFLALAATRYHDMPSTDEHEMEHNHGHKKAWGRAGMLALKNLAKKTGNVFINIHHNKSGSIDRGYVTGFINNPAGNKTVYVSINDGMNDILYRTAKHPADYTGGSNNTCSITPEGFAKIEEFLSRNLS